MEKFIQLKAVVEGLEADATKFFEKGNAAAGSRLRKGLQIAKALSQAVRVDVSARKKTAN